MKLTYFTDPGHGWLKVKKSLLYELGVSKKITAYSYIKGDWVYLEEDLDAGVFAEAAKAAGLPLEVTNSHTNSSSFIRRLPSYHG